jgi:hypothetical protein
MDWSLPGGRQCQEAYIHNIKAVVTAKRKVIRKHSIANGLILHSNSIIGQNRVGTGYIALDKLAPGLIRIHPGQRRRTVPPFEPAYIQVDGTVQYGMVTTMVE